MFLTIMHLLVFPMLMFPNKQSPCIVPQEGRTKGLTKNQLCVWYMFKSNE